MKDKNLKPILYFTLFLFTIGVFYSFRSGIISGSDNYTIVDKEKPKWKNLKVLPQDITKDSLIGLMHMYEDALGVDCAFCHYSTKGEDAKPDFDFASDEKMHKLISRGMIAMTQEINTKYFKPHKKPGDNSISVNCITCHMGNPEPASNLSMFNERMDKHHSHAKKRKIKKDKKQKRKKDK